MGGSSQYAAGRMGQYYFGAAVSSSMRGIGGSEQPQQRTSSEWSRSRLGYCAADLVRGVSIARGEADGRFAVMIGSQGAKASGVETNLGSWDPCHTGRTCIREIGQSVAVFRTEGIGQGMVNSVEMVEQVKSHRRQPRTRAQSLHTILASGQTVQVQLMRKITLDRLASSQWRWKVVVQLAAPTWVQPGC
ncbi:hypothetical protein N7532_004618 [Penicillium argentinense]|uniref:Uncharacterized protein n=1 Tax=Penicillium argentinense TaxID=1131581 RepID=A0A9W9FPT9_9EURO|nr:uncharacterized protein N7532_004618 [Penicillium argentinense]KAJ5104089.1 hypothetical protein N7532_004618 [Penicillium argentinense]